MSRYYITTPLYYVNDKPHIGTAYSTITADVLNRYHRLFGEETLFLTGTDEHGQKCAQAAAARGLSPQQHCDDMVQNFQLAWRELGVNYDIFFRTTDDFHVKAVQRSLQSLFDAGEIYAAEYEGWYSVSEEIFFTDKEVVDGKSPSGREVTRITEKNYFFKMSKYQAALVAHIENNPKFIQPDSRRNEVLGFLKQPLSDLCISRPKSRVSWGIEIPFDRDYVTYVWFDALLNYATAVGYQQPERQKDFEKWWTSPQAGAHHLIGKDILTTHSVYWTTMLMALKVPLPKQIFAHGWILNRDNNKMSKSQGEVVRPLDLKDKIGAEPLRYFLIRDVHLGNDAPFSQELVIQRVNGDLANNLGNLLSRSSNLIEKFFDGKLPAWGPDDEASRQLANQAEALAAAVQTSIHNMQPHMAIESIMALLSEANKYLEDKAPWKTAKTNLREAGHVLATATEVLRIAAILLSPVLPTKMAELLSRLSVGEPQFATARVFRTLKVGSPIRKGDPLFPRIE
jgi:methionyl-tRNA synthetase